MTTDELKQAVREYADREHPGWDVASVCVSRGPGAEPETIIVNPSRADGPPSPRG